MNVRTGLRLGDVLNLTYQCKWSLCALGLGREIEGFHVSCERVVVIATVVQICRPALRVAPNAILQHLVPHKAAACAGGGRIGSHEIWICGVRVCGSVHCFELFKPPLQLRVQRTATTTSLT